MNIRRLIATATVALASLFAQAAFAQTTVKDPWVRGTVPEQKATGAFLQITSATGGRLLSASSPVAGVVEIHQMSMDGNVMKMHAIAALDLPAGKTVELKPGGYHVMLLDLKGPLVAGQSIDLNLIVEGKDGKKETIAVKAPVRALDGSSTGGTAPAKH